MFRIRHAFQSAAAIVSSLVFPRSIFVLKKTIFFWFLQKPQLLTGAAVQQMNIYRQKVSTPLNTLIMFVPQQEAWVVERMGKFSRILEPGLNFLLPIFDRVKYVQSLKEIAIDVPKQSAITIDNVTLGIDGVLYLKVLDPYLGMSALYSIIII